MKYSFKVLNSFDRQIGSYIYSLDDMLKSHRGYVRSTIQEIRRRCLVGDKKSDWHKQLNIAWKQYRKYTKDIAKND